MEVAMEKMEDDLFFADLNKQISLLIMDEEDPVSHCPSSVSLQAFSRVIHPAAQPSFSYNQQNCRRESKGTGVFIPQSSHHRRKNNRQGRSFTSSSNTKPQRHSHENSTGLPQASHNNSFNPKRC